MGAIRQVVYKMPKQVTQESRGPLLDPESLEPIQESEEFRMRQPSYNDIFWSPRTSVTKGTVPSWLSKGGLIREEDLDTLRARTGPRPQPNAKASRKVQTPQKALSPAPTFGQSQRKRSKVFINLSGALPSL